MFNELSAHPTFEDHTIAGYVIKFPHDMVATGPGQVMEIPLKNPISPEFLKEIKGNKVIVPGGTTAYVEGARQATYIHYDMCDVLLLRPTSLEITLCVYKGQSIFVLKGVKWQDSL